jgi:hypothetical protein
MMVTQLTIWEDDAVPSVHYNRFPRHAIAYSVGSV